MKVTLYSAQPYDERFFEETRLEDFANETFELVYQKATLTHQTTALAEGSDAVCVFVNDVLDEAVLEALAALGVRAVVLRCAGFNNFALDGLLGMTMQGNTVGIVGTGRIGLATARIFKGLGCRILGSDPFPAEGFEAIGEIVDVGTLLAQSDIVSLHCPLLDATHHLINDASLSRMKPGAMLINTSRGALIDTSAVIEALKSRRLGALAIDVYEQESGLFFQDRSSEIIDDDVFSRLMTFPNVLVTGHQGFFTVEALREIAQVTFDNLLCFERGMACDNALITG